MPLPIRLKGLVPGVFILLLVAVPTFASQPQVNLKEIVQRSVDAMRADLNAASEFSYIEQDTETKGSITTVKTYKVLVIDGSPYYRLIGMNGHGLSAAQNAQEEHNLEYETSHRANESPQERARRIAKNQQDRRREFALLGEMMNAFDFRLVGEEEIEGRSVYRLQATPRPGYRPKSRETRILAAMRGELDIDKDTCQWVRAKAEVLKPVWLGWFIAKVQPGTRFLLEQGPVSGNLWQPTHFRVDVNASILWVQRNSVADKTYKDYQLVARR